MNDVFGNAGAGFVIFLLFVLVIALLVVVFNMNVRMNRLQRRYNLFMKGSDGQSVEKAMSSRLRELGKLRSGQEKSREDLIDLQQQYNSMLCKYGIVKYDAIEDVGGKMSFALAMLDQTNTGFVLNAIHSRDNCYLYLKDVVKGTSYIMLSDEEVEALRRASRFGEAEAAANVSRRKKHDEERARREAAEEAKAEKKLAAQAAQRRKRAETPEEAELRQLEEIIARSESRKPAASAETEAGQAAPRRPVPEAVTQTIPRRPAADISAQTAQEIQELSESIENVRRAAERRDAAAAQQEISRGPVPEPADPEQIREQIQEPYGETPVRKSAAARRMDEGMPELTE